MPSRASEACSTVGEAMRCEHGGRAPLVVEDRGPGVTGDSRWRAYIKGRTMGGYLNGFGSTWEEAVIALETRYEAELAGIRDGHAEMAKAMKPSRNRR